MFQFIISVFVFFNYTCGIWCSSGTHPFCLSHCLGMWRRAVEVTTMHTHWQSRMRRSAGGMDVTPFLTYFIENVYHKLVPVLLDPDTTEIFQNALAGAMSRKRNRPCGSLSSLSMGKASSPPSSWKRTLVMRPMQRFVDLYSSLRSLGCCGLQKYGNRIKYQIAK